MNLLVDIEFEEIEDGWLAWINTIPGMLVNAKTKELAKEELIKSLAAKLTYDYKLPIGFNEPSTSNLEIINIHIL